MDIWNILKIAATRDRKRIRRAFIARMKSVHPLRDLDAYEQLREAYELALEQIHVELSPDMNGRQFEPALGESAFDDSLAKDALQKAEHTPDYYLEQIIDKLDHENEKSAIFTLDQVLKEADFNSFHFLSQFEQSLQYMLTAYVPFAIKLARHAIGIFHWESDAARSLPAHLEAIHLMIALENARLKRKELEALARSKKTDDRHILNALLGPFRPLKFGWMILKPENIERMKYWLATLEKDFPEVIDLELDSETLEWWQDAITKPHMSRRGILVTGSVSSMFSLVILGAANIFIPEFDNHPFTLFMLFSVSFVVMLILSFSFKQLSFRLLEWQPSLRKVCTHIGDLCSGKFRSQVLMLPIFIMFYIMIVFSDGLMLIVFSVGGYLMLLLMFDVSLFFFINFMALFVGIMFRANPTMNNLLPNITSFGLHSLCVLDVALVYFLLNFILKLSGGTLRALFGIKHKPESDQHLYNFVLITFVLVIHVSFLGLPK